MPYIGFIPGLTVEYRPETRQDYQAKKIFSSHKGSKTPKGLTHKQVRRKSLIPGAGYLLRLLAKAACDSYSTPNPPGMGY
jgi:hypothetical protein